MILLYGHSGSDGRAEAPALLATALRRAYQVEQPARGVLPGGKPWFPDRPDLHFNVSHSGGLSLCGVGDAPLGVDIERVRPRGEGLPRRVLSAEELQWYEDRGGLWEDFYSLWTLKESLCKCTGRGLDRPPRLLRVPCLTPGQSGALDGFSFRAYGGAGWRAAACTPDPGEIGAEIEGW